MKGIAFVFKFCLTFSKTAHLIISQQIKYEFCYIDLSTNRRIALKFSFPQKQIFLLILAS